MDRGAWRAAVDRVAQSQTPLKQPSTHTRATGLTGVFQVTGKVHVKIRYQQSPMTLGSFKNSQEGTATPPSNCTPV